MPKQIVNWRTHLKFPEEARLTANAKDLISKLLCNVDQRLGTKGAEEIKVVMCLLSMPTWPPEIILQNNIWYYELLLKEFSYVTLGALLV